MKLFNLRLRTRIAIQGTLVILFSLLLGIVAYNQSVKIKLYAQLNLQVNEIQFEVTNLSNTVEKNIGNSNNFQSIKTLDSIIAQNNMLYNTYLIQTNKLAINTILSINSQIDTLSVDLKKFEVLRSIRASLHDSIQHFTSKLNSIKVSGSSELESLVTNYTKSLDNYFEHASMVTYTQCDSYAQRIKQQLQSAPMPTQIEIASLVSDLQNINQTIFKTDIELGFESNQGLRSSLLNKLRIASDLTKRLSAVIAQMTLSSRSNSLIYIILCLAFLFLAVAFLLYDIVYSVANPLFKIRDYMLQLVKGRLPEPLVLKKATNDDIGEMAENLNFFVQSLKDKAAFADEIGNGKLDVSYDPLSEDDILGNSLLEMEKSLQRAEQEDRKYKTEEQKRLWANEGVARFSEILRMNSHNLQILSDEIIKNLVKYLNGSLGGLYLKKTENEQDILVLSAAFAYDRKKFISQKIFIGEGLVGTCAIEKLTVFITDLPDDYIRIRSGLGESIPKSLLLVPLKLEEELLGVIELASFTNFNKQEIEFAEKIAESIASTISSVRINASTAELLAQSQKQAERMAEKEAELGQNIEELQATQEESARREQQFQSVLSAFEHALMVIEVDINGLVVKANEKLLQHPSVDRTSFVNKNISDWISLDEKIPEWRAALNKAVNGSCSLCYLPLHTLQGTAWLECNLSPVISSGGKVSRILLLLKDVTEQLNTASLHEEKDKMINTLSSISTMYQQTLMQFGAMCEILPSGQIANVNSVFCQRLMLTESELMSRKISSLIVEKTLVPFENNLKLALKGNSITAELEFISSPGKVVTYSFIPTLDKNGEVKSVVMICVS